MDGSPIVRSTPRSTRYSSSPTAFSSPSFWTISSSRGSLRNRSLGARDARRSTPDSRRLCSDTRTCSARVRSPAPLARPRVPTPSATPPSRLYSSRRLDFLARRNSRDRDPRPRPPTEPSSSWSAAEASPADASRRGVTPPPSWDALPARGLPVRGDRPRPSPNPPSRIVAPREASTRRARALRQNLVLARPGPARR